MITEAGSKIVSVLKLRPAEVDVPSRIGDWEGNTVIRKNQKNALLTLAERKMLYTFIVNLIGKRADLLTDALMQTMEPFMARITTFTFDNALEYAEYQRIAKGLGANVYFAHPYSSWERGINENTNGLIRQYFSKGSDFSTVTESEIQFVMDRLNKRPRKTRGGQSLNELFLGQSVDLLAA